jgi:DNA polymerase V
VRVRGNSMEDAGILSGDLLVVDRALKPSSGKIVVAAIDGELVVKRFIRRRGKIILEAASRDYGPLEIGDGQTLDVWGVVAGVVRRLD